MQQEDRRAKRTRRVAHQTKVEICARDKAASVFEAQSLNLSGRGMCVRSSFVPAPGTAIVLRFQENGEEAVIEGDVAWGDAPGPGLLGIRFTAVDSDSIRLLRSVCAAASEAAVPDDNRVSAANDEGSAVPSAESESATLPEPSSVARIAAGSDVRLHMAGLGAPMKARVFDSGGRLLSVGSQLEFLRLGSELEVEVGGVSGGRHATLHAVDISIDPETQIPHLVLSLGTGPYDADETPEPLVIEQVNRAQHSRAPASDADEELNEDEVDGAGDPDLELLAAEELFKGRVEAWASHAGRAMRDASRRVSGAAATLAERARAFPALKANKGEAESAGVRRSTSPAPRGSRPVPSAVRRTHRANGRVSRAPAAAGKSGVGALSAQKKGRWVAAAAALVLAGVGLTLARNPDEVASKGQESRLTASGEPSVMASSLPPEPGEFPEISRLDTEEQLAVGPNGIVAEVPLFGKQRLATTEAAPDTPSRSQVVDELSMAQDQVFGKTPALSKAAPIPQDRSDAAPGGDRQFQVGRMVLPVVHRLRLDGPGSALQGHTTESGFRVVIPGRRIMENGDNIAAHDTRITHVRVDNGPAGSTVTFRFKGKPPGFKARLRKDYVEFFVNSKTK